MSVSSACEAFGFKRDSVTSVASAGTVHFLTSDGATRARLQLRKWTNLTRSSGCITHSRHTLGAKSPRKHSGHSHWNATGLTAEPLPPRSLSKTRDLPPASGAQWRWPDGRADGREHTE
ncbi:hypothetical protein DPEC_G00074410 [Dallia pectoralis]|uniref:Uncharacterized protein n=1 Tax=Dallia pectoralis TaxID=75939 RepID=A0ACC2H3U2_DALPE|nr:hypothetical protein DPEC_G00074410 [Dallia pectoralis]